MPASERTVVVCARLPLELVAILERPRHSGLTELGLPLAGSRSDALRFCLENYAREHGLEARAPEYDGQGSLEPELEGD